VLINSANEIFIRKAMTHPNSIQKVSLVQINQNGSLKSIEIIDNTSTRLETMLKYLANNIGKIYKFEYNCGNVIIEGWKSTFLGDGLWITVDFRIFIEHIFEEEPKYEIYLKIIKSYWTKDTLIAVSKIKGMFRNTKTNRVMKLVRQIANDLFK